MSMVQGSGSSRVSSSLLLQMDTICDAFETDLREGKSPSIASYCRRIEPEHRARLERELIKIQKEFATNANDPNATSREPISDDSIDVTRQFAHYNLFELLGIGSFGEVWKAFDTRLHRLVALKIHRGQSASDHERFMREARASARLSHPRIVRILEVGQWQDRHYIVREFIEGQSLAELLQSQRLDNRSCAQLALQVVEGLEYSHAAGCIHRDLKPQNILLTTKGDALVTDFGLAKTQSASASATRSGEILGTPAYMSPEQARGRSHEVDGRADIWSLGIVLYQMLTGESPFRGSCEMVLLQILQDDPVDPRKLCKEVSDDLSTIALRCLEKDPRKRYPTATDLKLDLERYLDGRPISAKPISWIGKAWRWCNRNRSVAILMALVMLLLSAIAGGSLIATTQLVKRLRIEAALRKLSVTEAERARTQERYALEVTRFMESVFVASDPVGSELLRLPPGGKDTSAKELLVRASEKVRSEFPSQPRLQARLMDSIANVCRSLGHVMEAEQLLVDAKRIREPLFSESADDPYLKQEAIMHDYYRGCLAQTLGKTNEAKQIFDDTLQSAVAAFGGDDLLVAEIHFQSGWLSLESKQPADALKHFSKALAIREKRLPSSDKAVCLSRLALAQVSTSHDNSLLGAIEIAQGLAGNKAGELLVTAFKIQSFRASKRHEEAESLYRDALIELEKLFDPEDPRLLLAKGDFASLLFENGKYGESMKVIAPVLNAARRIAPRHPQYRSALVHVGSELMLAGKFEEAEKLLREAVDIGFDKPEQELEARQALSSVLYALRRNDAALQISERSMQLKVNRDIDKAWRAYIHGKALEINQQLDAANSSLIDAIAFADRCDVSTLSAHACQRLAIIYSHSGMHEKAIELRLHGLRLEETQRPSTHPKVSEQLNALGALYETLNQPDKAFPLVQRALAIREATLPSDDPRIEESRRLLRRLTN